MRAPASHSRAAGVSSFICLLLGASLAHAAPPVGANLRGVSDWSRSHEFADLVKQSRSFGPANAPWAGGAPVDERGWPTDDAGLVLMCCQPPGIGLGGIYEFSAQCNTLPTIELFNSSGFVQNVQYNAGTGQLTGQFVFPESGQQIFMAFRNTQGGVRNLRMMRPFSSPTDSILSAYEQHVQPFAAFRFMDWNRTNNNPTVRWSQRSRVEDATYRWKTGVPYEVCVDLCNTTGRDAWLCIPHMADEEFVRELARLMRDRLHPQLNVYVEYSNEVWNYLFDQAGWNYDQAQLEAAQPGSVLRYDGTTDTEAIRLRRIAKRTVEIGQVFAQEFGPGSLNTRIRPIIASQFVQPNQHLGMLRFIEAVYGPPRQHVWAVAGAPYFDARPEDQENGLSTSQILDALQRSVDELRTETYYERYAAMTAWYDLRAFIAYEGGPDVAGGNNLASKRLANYEARMALISEQYLHDWYAAGGGLMMWFSAGAGSWEGASSGMWTLVETLGDTSAKLDAILNTLADPMPPVTAGTAFPGTVDPRRHVQREPGWDTPPALQVGVGDRRDYLLRVDQAGTYPVRFQYTMILPSAQLGVSVNNGPETILTMTQAAQSPQPRQWSAPIALSLRAGLNVLRIRAVDDGYAWSMHAIASTCDGLDFNNDGLTQDPTDLEAFLSVYSGSTCVPPQATCNDLDFNNDGISQDPTDLEAFFQVYSGGPCQ